MRSLIVLLLAAAPAAAQQEGVQTYTTQWSQSGTGWTRTYTSQWSSWSDGEWTTNGQQTKDGPGFLGKVWSYFSHPSQQQANVQRRTWVTDANGSWVEAPSAGTPAAETGEEVMPSVTPAVPGPVTQTRFPTTDEPPLARPDGPAR